MAKMALEDRAELTAFLNDEGGSLPRLSDLALWWDSIPPDAPHPDHPEYSARTILLGSYVNWSHTKQWAREGLRQLLAELLKRREPIPEILQTWAFHTAANAEATRRPGRQEKSDRNARIMAALRLLHKSGHSQEDAMYTVAEALDVDYETIRSVVRKVKNDRPFNSPRDRKGRTQRIGN